MVQNLVSGSSFQNVSSKRLTWIYSIRYYSCVQISGRQNQFPAYSSDRIGLGLQKFLWLTSGLQECPGSSKLSFLSTFSILSGWKIALPWLGFCLLDFSMPTCLCPCFQPALVASLTLFLDPSCLPVPVVIPPLSQIVISVISHTHAHTYMTIITTKHTRPNHLSLTGHVITVPPISFCLAEINHVVRAVTRLNACMIAMPSPQSEYNNKCPAWHGDLVFSYVLWDSL